jgi:hypothetical protein
MHGSLRGQSNVESELLLESMKALLQLEESDRHSLPGHFIMPIRQFSRLIRFLPQLFYQGDIVQPNPLWSSSSHVLH